MKRRPTATAAVPAAAAAAVTAGTTRTRAQPHERAKGEPKTGDKQCDGAWTSIG